MNNKIYKFNELSDNEQQQVRLKIATLNYQTNLNSIIVTINLNIEKKIIITNSDKNDFCNKNKYSELIILNLI